MWLFFCRPFPLIMVLFLIPISIIAKNNRLPPSLPEAANLAVVPTLSSTLNTPEYVIVRSNEETTFSSETTGQVISLPVKEGTAFKMGDLLLTLDCRLQAAELAKAKAIQAATTKAYQSAKKLQTYGSISEFELIKSKSEAEESDADVQRLQVTVEKCNIVAPFNGSVAEIKIHLYETVKPGDPLLKVVNTESLTFEVQVPSEWLSWLRIGSSFNVYVNDISKSIPSKVTLINPEIEPISQTVKISGSITPANQTLRPGMTGQAIFKDNPEKQVRN